MSEKNKVKVSFILPCYNEELYIIDTLARIKSEAESIDLNYEIIVVDNMSTDRSLERVKRFGVTPLISKATTVSAVRNCGFSQSTGDVLVFLDGDVYLADGWGKRFKTILPTLIENKQLITGSHCSVPTNLKQPFLSWYKGIELDRRNTHLGTGHMIMHRELFLRVGMFDDELYSGEDFEFCAKARRLGSSIINDDNLKAYHMGYPDNIISFIKRECWHGIGDVRSMQSFISSKVALFTILFVFINILMLVSIIYLNFWLLGFSCVVLFLILSVVIINKFSIESVSDYFCKLFASYFYFAGRSLAMLAKKNKG